MEKSPTLLIIGGNGFIGAEVVDFLLEHNPEYKLVLLNRGHWNDWDNSTRIKPRIHESLIWDRRKDSLGASLRKYLDDESFQFDAVIDFSAYKKKDISSVLDELPRNKFKLYILISTDSVYEVCVDKQPDENGEVVLCEHDSIRSESEEQQKRLKKLDSYGHHKLKCEEKLLSKANRTHGFDYIILRLPDVIGPRDSTERFWVYQLYLQFIDEQLKTNPNLSKYEIEIPKLFMNKKTSYVYVKDIAKAISAILKSDVKNQIFNIGFDTPLTIVELYKLMASLIRPGLEQSLNFKPVEECYKWEAFPSVTKGRISIEKIKTMLKFEPSDLRESFAETIHFYDQALEKHAHEKKRIEKSIRKEILNDEQLIELFNNFIINKKMA